MAYATGWQRFEGLTVFVGGLGLLWHAGLPFGWWVAVLVFLLPDVSFAGYAAGPRIGALAYNTVHIYGFGVVMAVAGQLTGLPWLAACGLLWLAHSGFDRMMGYGLKLPTGFSDTHLGTIGRKPR